MNMYTYVHVTPSHRGLLAARAARGRLPPSQHLSCENAVKILRNVAKCGNVCTLEVISCKMYGNRGPPVKTPCPDPVRKPVGLLAARATGWRLPELS